LKNKKSSQLNTERPNYNTQSIIEILEEKSKSTKDKIFIQSIMKKDERVPQQYPNPNSNEN